MKASELRAILDPLGLKIDRHPGHWNGRGNFGDLEIGTGASVGQLEAARKAIKDAAPWAMLSIRAVGRGHPDAGKFYLEFASFFWDEQPEAPRRDRPRTVTRWENGEKRIAVDVVPTPFGRERAAEIMTASADPFKGDMHKHMTDGEIAYVLNLWDENPNGASTFSGTVAHIKNG